MIFVWNEWNLAHIAGHGVGRVEAEHVVARAQSPFPRQLEEEKFVVWGQTVSGRFLQVVFVFLGDEDVDLQTLDVADRLDFASGNIEFVYIIHSRELTSIEKRRQRRKQK